MGKQGLAFVLPGLKNDASHIGKHKVVADTGKPGCFARTFRQLVLDLSPDVQLPKVGEWGFASGPNSDRYLFRRGRIKKASAGGKKHSHRHMTWETEHIEGDGELPINCEKGSAAYMWWMRKLRQALLECCGLSKSAASKYGTHSLKRGGNTALFLAKAPKQH